MDDDIILAVRATDTSVQYHSAAMKGSSTGILCLSSPATAAAIAAAQLKSKLCILSNLDWRLRNVGLQHRHGTHEIPFSLSPAEERAWP